MPRDFLEPAAAAPTRKTSLCNQGHAVFPQANPTGNEVFAGGPEFDRTLSCKKTDEAL